jgi:uncharacterized protein YuzE
MSRISRRGVLFGQSVDRLQDRGLDVDYDKEADVLYINFGPAKPADSNVLNNDIILHYKGEKIIGITVPSFRKRMKWAFRRRGC